MATGKVNFVNINFLRRCKSFKTLNRCQKLFYCTESTGKTEVPKIVSGFAASYEKQSKILNRPEVEVERFSTLLRHSKFIDLGDPQGKVVIGTIYRVVDDDLYIDFGWKFPAICSKPKKNRNLFIVGAQVKLLIVELEMCTRFMGNETDTTLLEADCILLGLAGHGHWKM